MGAQQAKVTLCWLGTTARDSHTHMELWGQTGAGRAAERPAGSLDADSDVYLAHPLIPAKSKRRIRLTQGVLKDRR